MTWQGKPPPHSGAASSSQWGCLLPQLRPWAGEPVWAWNSRGYFSPRSLWHQQDRCPQGAQQLPASRIVCLCPAVAPGGQTYNKLQGGRPCTRPSDTRRTSDATPSY